jgi:hypothetical protein
MNTKWINLARKGLKNWDAERELAMAEYRRLFGRLERLLNRPRRTHGNVPTLTPYEGGLSEAESEKRKSGRPKIWRGFKGFLLVQAVEKIRTENPGFSIARAIRRAIKMHPILKGCKDIHRLKDRGLQARYQQAAGYWSSALQGEITKDMERASERLDMAIETMETLRGLLADLEGRDGLSVTQNDFM